MPLNGHVKLSNWESTTEKSNNQATKPNQTINNTTTNKQKQKQNQKTPKQTHKKPPIIAVLQNRENVFILRAISIKQVLIKQ